MSLWVVVGGQYGAEGKGKIAAFLTLSENIDICVRCGGPNSGHSFVCADGSVQLLRQLPTGYIRSGTRLLIPAGALIDLRVLRKELEDFAIAPGRVGIDRSAMIIEPADLVAEAALRLDERLSSTLSGVGSALSRRVLRTTGARLASDAAAHEQWLRPMLANVAAEVNAALDVGKNVLIEGTQGFGLSLYHSHFYPKATSRDTTAASFLSEVGVSPRLVDELVVVLRTFPIRVSGQQAGPLETEVSWETVQQESGAPFTLCELTSVTRKVRRIGRFEWQLALEAISVNRPTRLALNGLDYLNYANCGLTSWDDLSSDVRRFVAELECRSSTPVSYLGTGPSLSAVITRSTDSVVTRKH